MFTGLKVNAQISDFNYTIADDVQVSDRIIEFDLYLLDTNTNEPFELAAIQAGIIVNSEIYNGGTISVSIVSGSSQLNASQQPASILWVQATNAIKLTPKSPPGVGSGTIISQTAPGTRICRIRITNSIAFTINSTANLTFNFTTSPYPTKVSQYISGSNNVLVCNSINTFSNANNLVVNPPVAAFEITGGGSYCQGSGGLPVGLVNSENGVTYTLFKDGIPQVPAVVGTGAAITFGNQLFGAYTVNGSNMGGTTPMTGSAVISEIPIPAAPIISSIDNYLESSSVTGNQWYNSSEKIIGAIGQRYTPLSNGNYYVLMTNSDGCISEVSNTISFTTGIEKIGLFEGISVYPNPATCNLIIDNNSFLSKVEFEIVNSSGMKIYTSILDNISIVDLGSFLSGVYYIRFTKDGFYYHLKFIKQ